MRSSTSVRWWALGALALTILAVGLDGTILNTALPTVSTELGASTSQLQWFTNSYNLVMAAMLLPAGLLGDRYGRKWIMQAALATFGVGSVWCAFSHSSAQLIAARSVLGLGAAFLIPLCMSCVLVLFEPEERHKAVSAMTSANMIGFPLGPILGGFLLQHFWWGSVFLVNVPVVLFGLAAVTALVPESRSPSNSRLDLFGALISAIGMVAVTYGVIHAGAHGWGDPTTLAMVLGGVAVLVLFVAWERRVSWTRDPMVDLGLFHSRGFTWGTILATVVSFAMFGLLFNTPQYFQAVLGADALGTGLRLLPLVGGLVVGVLIANRMIKPVGPKVPVTIGFGLMASGLLLGSGTDTGSGYGFAAVWIAVFGLGLGFAMSTTTMAAVGALSRERGGAGSALILALRQLGSAIGVGILGSLATSAYRARLDTGGLSPDAGKQARTSVAGGAAVAHRLGSAHVLDDVRSAFVHGMDLTLWVCGGISVAGLLLTLAFLPGRSRSAVPAASGHEPSDTVSPMA